MSVLKEAPVVSSSVNTFKCPAPKKPKSSVSSATPEEKKSDGNKNTKSPLEINAHHQKRKTKHVKDFNDIFSCYLCHGYLINATTIDNCLHSFCRSCIVNYLLTSAKNNHCPKCGNAERTVNLSNLRRDEQLQSVVYKIVPDLYKKEMERQENFHNGHNSVDPFVYDNKFFSSRDPISLSLEYYITSAECLNDLPPIKYLQCPAAVTVHHLQKFLCSKYNIDLDNEKLTIDIIYEEEILPTSFMLMDIAYTFNWKRCAPLRLFYRILIKNLCNKLETKTEQTEEENLVPKNVVVKTVRFKDEDSKNATNILKSRKSIKLFHNNNNTITNLKTVTTTEDPSKQNVLMATFGRKKEVKINKHNNNYTPTFVKDFKSLRSNDICKPVEKKCNTIPTSNIKPMVSIPQIEVQRALKHSGNAINKLSIKEEKPIDIPKIKICVPKTVKSEPIDPKMFRKLSIDERPVNESVDLETYVKKIGLQPIDKKVKLSPNTSPSSSCSSSASSVTSTFSFNNNDSEHHRHSLSSSSSHKKRKKSKHSKELKDKDSGSSSKKRKIHAEISSSNENLKLKVKINHHSHKNGNDKVVKIVDAPILAPAQLSKAAIEKLRSEPLPPPPQTPVVSSTPVAKPQPKTPVADKPAVTTSSSSKPVPIKCPPITAIKIKDSKLPISPPLPPSLFKTVPHTIQTVPATSTLPIPAMPPYKFNKDITKSNKEKFIMPSPPKTSSTASATPASPLKVNLITSIASEANRQASIKRSISADDSLESKRKMAKLGTDDGKQARRISFGSFTSIPSKPSKSCDDFKKNSTSNVKLPQPIILPPTKATRPPPPTIPLLKIKRSQQPPASPTNNNNEPPGLISMKSMKGLGTNGSPPPTTPTTNNVLDLSRNNLKVDAKNSIEDALKKIRQNHNYSSVSSTSSSDLKTLKPDNKIQSQRILPNLTKINEISKIRPQNSSVRSIPNPSALIRNIQEVPALATISPIPTTNGKDIKVEKSPTPTTNGSKDTSEDLVSSSTVSSQSSNSATDDEKKMKKNLNLEILAANLNMRAAAAADSKVSPKGSNNVVSTSTSVVSSTESSSGSAKTTPSGNFSISSLVATAASPKSV